MPYKTTSFLLLRVFLATFLTLLVGKFIFDLVREMEWRAIDPVPFIVGTCGVVAGLVSLFLPVRLKRVETALLVFPAVCLLWSMKHVVVEGAAFTDLYRLSLGMPLQENPLESYEGTPGHLLAEVATGYFRERIFHHFWTAVPAATVVFCLAGRQRRRDQSQSGNAPTGMIPGHLLALSPPILFWLSGIYFGTTVGPFGEVVASIFDF